MNLDMYRNDLECEEAQYNLKLLLHMHLILILSIFYNLEKLELEHWVLYNEWMKLEVL